MKNREENTCCEKPRVGKPHMRFDANEVALETTTKRGAPLGKKLAMLICALAAMAVTPVTYARIVEETEEVLTNVVSSAIKQKKGLGQADAKAVQFAVEVNRTASAIQRKLAGDLLVKSVYYHHSLTSTPTRVMLNSLEQSAEKSPPNEVVNCEILCDVSDGLLARIKELGGRVVSSSKRFGSIHAYLPLASLETLGKEESVRSIREAHKPMLNKVNTSEGDVSHRAAIARSTYNVDGSGIKIGVISDSVRYLSQVQESGDLPSGVNVLTGLSGINDYPDGSSYADTGEGTAMLEIVHDLCPGASLYFATSGETEAEMAENILALKNAGCDIIVDDICFRSESAFQEGIVAQAVKEVYDAGKTYVTCAANKGNYDRGFSGVWEGDFNPSASTVTLEGVEYEQHEFPDGSTGNLINYWSVGNVFTLQWSDPLGASGNDYELAIYDYDTGTWLQLSGDVQDGNDDPYDWCQITAKIASYRGLGLRVLRKKGAANRYIRVAAFNSPSSAAGEGRLEMSTAGMVYGHNASQYAVSVAATEYVSGRAFSTTDKIAYYSSDGPRKMFYDINGSAYTTSRLASGGRVFNKPDFAAASSVSCTTPDFETFGGTSAAAPHIAAICGLMLQANRGLTQVQLLNILTNAVVSPHSGWNRTYGYGMVDAAECVRLARDGESSGPAALNLNIASGSTSGSCSVENDGSSWKIVESFPSWIKGITFYCPANGNLMSLTSNGTSIGFSGEASMTVNCSTNDSGATRTWDMSISNRTARTIQYRIHVVQNPHAAGPVLPINDNFANATQISGASGTLTDSNAGATMQSSEPTPSAQPNAKSSVWYKWTAPSSGTVTFDTIGSSFDTVLGAYTGSTLTSLSEITSDDDGGGSGYTSRMSFQVLSGTTYWIAAYGYNGNTGSIKLNWSLTSTITYSVTYALNGGTHGATHPTTATYDTAFYVSAPTKSGYTFTGWTVTSGLNTSTAKWGTTSSPSTSLTSPTTKCANGATGNVYFKNLRSTTGSVTLAANWTENVVALPTALDNTMLSFTSGGGSSWFGQTTITHDGVDAVQSGALGNSQTNWLQTTVTGPGTISFWWYASSEQNWDFLEFMIDGDVVGSMSGTNNVWTSKSFEISTSGTHTLQWRYRKDGSQYRGLDAGFVDQVTWTPSAASGPIWTIDASGVLTAVELNGCNDLVVPDGVTSIAPYAITNCNVTSIVVPNSVTNIAMSAFWGCGSVTNMVLPFVGSKRGNTGTDDSVFGHIFGRKSYNGGESSAQSYIKRAGFSATWTHYIPAKLKTVTITDETIIAVGAFSSCKSLVGVTLPESVTSIGDFAFEGCRMLANIHVPASVNHIGGGAFSGYYNGIEVSIDAGNRAYHIAGDGAMYSMDDTTLVFVPSGKTSFVVPNSVANIGNAAFYYCRGLIDVSIPASVTNISDFAFYGCEALATVSIPDSVQRIGGEAFDRCFLLSAVSIGSGVTTIGCYAFCYCNRLTDVIIPRNVVDMEGGVFARCGNLTDVTILGALNTYSQSSFYLDISAKVTTHVTANWTGPTDAWLGSTVDLLKHTISFNANGGIGTMPDQDVVWYATSNLIANAFIRTGYTFTGWATNATGAVVYANGASITPSSDTILYAKWAVNTSTEFPYKLVNGNAVITNYTGTSGDVIFPAVIDGHPVTEIAANAFYYGTYPFVNVTISEGIQKIGHAAFGYSSVLETFSIPSTLTMLGDSNGFEFISCPKLRRVDVAAGNPNYKSVDGVLYNKAGTTLIYCPASKDPDGDFTVPASVARIEKYAFDCSRFRAVVLPEGLRTIEDNVFWNASRLVSMEIPETVGSIGRWAFCYCSSLADVRLPSSLTAIGQYAFTSTKVGALDVPAGVTSIGQDAFKTTSLTNLILRSRVATTYASNKWGSNIDNSKVWVMRADVDYWQAVFGTGFNILDPETIPPIAEDATPETVTNAIVAAGFADADAVMATIAGNASEYIAFKTWASGIVGGEAAVVASANAAASYLLGADRLFVNTPEIEFGECEVASDTGEITVSITVKDGDDTVAVASEKVKEMFEATSDLDDWTSAAKKLTPTVTDLTDGRSDNLNFKVRPGDGTSPRAFLRIRK